MLYALWYRLKGPGATWYARDFLSDRTRGQFISRHKHDIDSWAIDALDIPPFPALTLPDSPPPEHLTVHRRK